MVEALSRQGVDRTSERRLVLLSLAKAVLDDGE